LPTFEAALADSHREALEMVSKVESSVLDAMRGVVPTTIAVDKVGTKTAVELAGIVGQATGCALKKVDHLSSTSVAQGSTIRQLEAQIEALLAKDGEWVKLEQQLQAHQKVFTRHCVEFQRRASDSRLPTLGPEEQVFIAGNIQLVADHVASLSDLLTIQSMVNFKGQLDEREWDDQVEAKRAELFQSFVSSIAEASSQTEAFDPVLQEARALYISKVSMALQVALTKYRRIAIASTIFGKQKLVATCVACNRPLNDASPQRRNQERGAPSPLKATTDTPSTRFLAPPEPNSPSGGSFPSAARHLDDGTVFGRLHRSDKSPQVDRAGGGGPDMGEAEGLAPLRDAHLHRSPTKGNGIPWQVDMGERPLEHGPQYNARGFRPTNDGKPSIAARRAAGKFVLDRGPKSLPGLG